MEKEFIEEITDIFDKEELVNWDDKFRAYENWSSLIYLTIVAMVDEKYDVVISREEFINMVTIKDIYEYIVKVRAS